MPIDPDEYGGNGFDFERFPFEPYPVGHVGPPDGKTIEEAFLDFHKRNPHVYDELVRLARRAQRRGVSRFGIGAMFEVLRWRYALRTQGDEFKLNNNHRSYYSRLIQHNEPDLEGFFQTRKLHA